MAHGNKGKCVGYVEHIILVSRGQIIRYKLSDTLFQKTNNKQTGTKKKIQSSLEAWPMGDGTKRDAGSIGGQADGQRADKGQILFDKLDSVHGIFYIFVLLLFGAYYLLRLWRRERRG